MLPSIRSIHLLVVFLSGLLAATAAHAAEPAAGKAAAKKLLDAGWDKSAAARAAVDRQYGEAEKIAPNDPYLRYAYWLVLMHQGRYDDSRDSLNDYLKSYSTNLQAWRAKTWNETILGEYAQAITSAESLGQLVAPGKTPNNGPVSDDHKEAIIFLGRLAGFLEGPLEKVVVQEKREKFETQMLERFDEPRKKLFEEAKRSVLDKHQGLINDAANAGQGAKQLSEAEKQKKLEKLAKDNEQLDKAAKKVEEREKQLAEQANKTLAELNQRDAALAQQLLLLQNQVIPLTNQLNQQRAGAQRLQQQAATEQDPLRRQNKQFDAQRAADLADGTQRQLDNLNSQSLAVNANRNAIQQLKIQAQGGAVIQAQQLEGALKGLDFEKQKLGNKQKKEEKAKEPSSSKTRALESQARAFTTYDPFTIGELKAALLTRLQ